MRTMILGTPCDVLSMSETVKLIDDRIASGKPLRQVSLNVAKLVNMRWDPDLHNDVVSSDIISIDGAGVVLAGLLTGVRGVQRVAGIDLMEQLLAVCAERGYRPYFLGATSDVVAKAVEVACKRHPGLTFAGWRDGYFTADEEDEVVRDIRAARPDCLFIAMPSPRKERFMHAHKDVIDAGLIMGVGGSLDVLANVTARAPIWMQRAGLEWFHRVLQEPRRLWWRYARTNTLLIGLIFREWFLLLRSLLFGAHSYTADSN